MAEISSERIAELKARVKAECLRRCHIDSVESYGGEKYDFSRDPEKDNVAIEEHAEKILTPLNAINSAKFPSTRGDRVISDSELTTEEAFLTVAEARAVTDHARAGVSADVRLARAAPEPVRTLAKTLVRKRAMDPAADVIQAARAAVAAVQAAQPAVVDATAAAAAAADVVPAALENAADARAAVPHAEETAA